MRRSPVDRRRVALSVVALLLTAVALAACAAPGTARVPHDPAGAVDSGPGYTAAGGLPVLTRPYAKVMIIAEENEEDSAVIGSRDAPYLTRLAHTYGNATDMQAGYPVDCPSLAAYLIITSGGRHGICDDDPPSAHHLSGNNIFDQVAGAGLQWREYAESMTSNCQATDGPGLLYVVRHAPPPYYSTESSRCAGWDVPMGTTTSGALHDALARGLPDYSFVTPNTCDEMHGAPSCRSDRVKRGDDWLARWMPQILASPDFQAARLVVIITWDEGSATSNHIPTLIVARTVRGVASSAALNHCSTLRASEEVLGLPLLGCAATAVSLRTAFGF